MIDSEQTQPAAPQSSSSVWWGKLPEAVVPSWGLLAAVLVGLVLGILVQAAVVALDLILFNRQLLMVADGLIGRIVVTAAGLIPLMIYVSRKSQSLANGLLLVKPGKDSKQQLLRAIAIYLLLSISSLVLLAVIYPELEQVDQELGVDPGVRGWRLATGFFMLVIFTPVVEEVLYRGFLFRGIARSTNVLVGLILSSLIFGAVHGQLTVGVDTFMMGAVACWLIIKTGSLWPSIILHALKNAVAFYFLFISPLL